MSIFLITSANNVPTEITSIFAERFSGLRGIVLVIKTLSIAGELSISSTAFKLNKPWEIV